MVASNQATKKNDKLYRSRSNSIQHKTIYYFVFIGFLFFECISYLVKKIGRPHTTADFDRESPISMAKGAADSSVPHIFNM